MINLLELSVKKRILVSEKGSPDDGKWCFITYTDNDGEYDWSTGGYSETN